MVLWQRGGLAAEDLAEFFFCLCVMAAHEQRERIPRTAYTDVPTRRAGGFVRVDARPNLAGWERRQVYVP